MASKKFPYHSALHDPIEVNGSLDYFEKDGNVALVNNVLDGIPSVFNKCDILYSEISWIDGLDKFNKRANSSLDFTQYITAINSIIRNSKVPTIIIGSIKILSKIEKPHQILETKINGANAKAFVYNYDFDGMHSTTTSIILNIASKFNCVGDFCCGYGNTGRIFKKMNKKFVMSDYNSKCIKFISDIYEDL
jgi:hypothetical protein